MVMQRRSPSGRAEIGQGWGWEKEAGDVFDDGFTQANEGSHVRIA